MEAWNPLAEAWNPLVEVWDPSVEVWDPSGGPKLGFKLGPTIRVQNWAHNLGPRAQIPSPWAQNWAHGPKFLPYGAQGAQGAQGVA